MPEGMACFVTSETYVVDDVWRSFGRMRPRRIGKSLSPTKVRVDSLKVDTLRYCIALLLSASVGMAH